VPDLITLAKGLTSAYAPLSAVLVGSRVFDVLESHSDAVGLFSHGYTYSGHPICVAAANANLDIWEREQLTERAATRGAYLQSRLRKAFEHHPFVGEVRGIGLLAAVEFVRDPATKTRFSPETRFGARVSQAARDSGLIARAMPHGDILGFAPPLVIQESEIDELVDIATKAVAEVTDSVTRGDAT
jgi:L-2,4-diaminobutyrate transaminase